jgi:hypothetical protein
MPRKKNTPKLDEKFYVDTIKVLDWLKCNDPQRIRFQDRMEYKVNNQLHREDGPAIEFFSGIGDQFYINGKRYSDDEFKNYRRTKLIDEMIDGK